MIILFLSVRSLFILVAMQMPEGLFVFASTIADILKS